MSRVGFLWCHVCKAWRPAQHSRPCCHRCGWDLRATVTTRVDVYRTWRELDDR